MTDGAGGKGMSSGSRGPGGPNLWGRRAAAACGAALALQYLPSLAALGQWSPLETVPGDLCRWRGPGRRPEVALTFDDGPHQRGTPAVLDRLDELGLPATFFVVGSAVEAVPELVADIARRGHGVATHGHRHRHHLLMPPGRVDADLEAAARVMAATGVRPRWYRPAFGQVTAETLLAARRRGWRTVLWSAWGREWATSDPAEVVARIACRLRPGAIVLLHDSDAFGPSGMWKVVLDALEPLAAELDKRGLQAVPLDRLVE